MTGRSRRDPAVRGATLLPPPPPPARRAAADACVIVGRRKAVRTTISKLSIPIVGTRVGCEREGGGPENSACAVHIGDI